MIENPEEHFVGLVAQKALIEREGKVLMVKHINDNRWDFPGGRLNRDEDLRKGLLRELEEEIGCVCEIGELIFSKQYFHTHADKNCLFLNFEAKLTDGDQIVIPDDELSEFKWLDINEVEPEQTFPNCIETINAYKQNL